MSIDFNHGLLDSSGSGQQDPAANAISGSDQVVVVDQHGQPYRHNEGPYKKFKNLVGSVTDRIPHGDRLMIFLTGIITISTVSQIAISCDNNKKSGQQVDRLIVAADRINDAADSFSRSASSINEGVKTAATQLGVQAGATETQAQASLRSANAQEIANNAVAKQFALAQRPWITIDDSQFSFKQGSVWVGVDAEGQMITKQPSELMSHSSDEVLGNFPLSLNGVFTNTGLSPALLISQDIHAPFIKVPPSYSGNLSDSLDIPVLKECSRSFALPTSGTITGVPKFPYEFHFPIQLPGKEIIDEWIAGKRVWVAYGCIRYADELGYRHQKNFCAYRLHGVPKWDLCDKGNDDPW